MSPLMVIFVALCIECFLTPIAFVRSYSRMYSLMCPQCIPLHKCFTAHIATIRLSFPLMHISYVNFQPGTTGVSLGTVLVRAGVTYLWGGLVNRGVVKGVGLLHLEYFLIIVLGRVCVWGLN